MEPKEGVYVGPAYEAVVEGDNWIECGTGPERVVAGEHDNPNWLRNRAANCIALADWLESKESRAEEQSKEKILQVIRDIEGHPMRAWADLTKGEIELAKHIIELESLS